MKQTSVVIFFLDSSELCVEGFGTEEVLNAAGYGNIPVRDVKVKDETSVCLTVRTSDVSHLMELLGNRYRTEVLARKGILPYLRRATARKGLLAGAVFFFAVLFLQQSFIAELRIQGDGGIPESEIAEVLRENGLYPGCRKSQVDEEAVKTALYLEFPELTWTGLDMKGALAVLETVSGEKPAEEDENSDAPCDIVASKSGYIKEIITRHGTQMVGEGDYVQQGDVLISSEMRANNTTYDESRNNLVTYVRAEGDVIASVVYVLETQFVKGKFTEDEMRKMADTAVRKYIREKIPEKIEILKKDLKFSEEENIIICRISLEISENIGYEKETEFAGT